MNAIRAGLAWRAASGRKDGAYDAAHPDHPIGGAGSREEALVRMRAARSVGRAGGRIDDWRWPADLWPLEDAAYWAGYAVGRGRP